MSVPTEQGGRTTDGPDGPDGTGGGDGTGGTGGGDRLESVLGDAPPANRPRAVGTFVLPVLAAAVIGVLVGRDPVTVLTFGVAAVVAVTMVLRLEWAVHVVVVASCFGDYLQQVSPWAMNGLAVLLVASWVVRRAWGPLHRGRGRPVLACAAVLAGVLVLATLAHTNGSAATTVLERWAGLLAVLLVVADAISAGMSARSVARTYVWSCVAASVCALVVLAVTLPGDQRVAGPVGDANDFAFFLLAAVALTPALRGGARRALTYDIGLGILVVALLGTLSRGALVGLVIVFVVAVVLRVLPLKTAAGVAAVGVTLAAIAVAATPDAVSTMLEEKGAVSSQNVEERAGLWNAAASMTADQPLLGVGPGGFSLFLDDYRDTAPTFTAQPRDDAHDTYLEISAEAGLVGLAAWLALLAAGVTSAWTRWRADRDPLAGWTTVALAGLIGASVLATEHLVLPMWLLLALAAGLDTRESRVDDQWGGR